MDLQPGQNFSITRHPTAPAVVEIELGWEPTTTPLILDSSAFALTGQGKVRDDGDFVFYNQPALAGGGIHRGGDGRIFTLTFAQLPAGIERIVIALTIDRGQQRGNRSVSCTRCAPTCAPPPVGRRWPRFPWRPKHAGNRADRR
jgi:stress response protein SCP2